MNSPQTQPKIVVVSNSVGLQYALLFLSMIGFIVLTYIGGVRHSADGAFVDIEGSTATLTEDTCLLYLDGSRSVCDGIFGTGAVILLALLVLAFIRYRTSLLTKNIVVGPAVLLGLVSLILFACATAALVATCSPITIQIPTFSGAIETLTTSKECNKWFSALGANYGAMIAGLVLGLIHSLLWFGYAYHEHASHVALASQVAQVSQANGVANIAII